MACPAALQGTLVYWWFNYEAQKHPAGWRFRGRSSACSERLADVWARSGSQPLFAVEADQPGKRDAAPAGLDVPHRQTWFGGNSDRGWRRDVPGGGEWYFRGRTGN